MSDLIEYISEVNERFKSKIIYGFYQSLKVVWSCSIDPILLVTIYVRYLLLVFTFKVGFNIL